MSTLDKLEAQLVRKSIFVITTAKQGKRASGMTAAWVTRVAGNPPLMAVAIHCDSFTGELIAQTGWYVINVLALEQANLARHFGMVSSRQQDKFRDLTITFSQHGCPILLHVLGYLECRVTQSLKVGDHQLFIGEIIDGKRLRDGQPLVYSPALEE